MGVVWGKFGQDGPTLRRPHGREALTPQPPLPPLRACQCSPPGTPVQPSGHASAALRARQCSPPGTPVRERAKGSQIKMPRWARGSQRGMPIWARGSRRGPPALLPASALARLEGGGSATRGNHGEPEGTVPNPRPLTHWRARRAALAGPEGRERVAFLCRVRAVRDRRGVTG